MCGRYTLTRPAREAAAAFDAGEPPEMEPRYNVAPTQSVLVVRAADAGRECALMRWGLVPHWSDRRPGPPLINAMAETAASKPAFRTAFQKRRCLVPADGFYEWLAQGKKRHPYLFALSDGGLFAFAGLWDLWEREGERPESVCILTTEANELVRPLHERMPVMLTRDAAGAWLDHGQGDPERLQGLLRPFPASMMTGRPVSTAVNNFRNEGPRCVEPAEPEGGGPAQASLF
jgi:putative SOS response-associated peptidase YedK